MADWIMLAILFSMANIASANALAKSPPIAANLTQAMRINQLKSFVFHYKLPDGEVITKLKWPATGILAMETQYKDLNLVQVSCVRSPDRTNEQTASMLVHVQLEHARAAYKWNA